MLSLAWLVVVVAVAVVVVTDSSSSGRHVIGAADAAFVAPPRLFVQKTAAAAFHPPQEKATVMRAATTTTTSLKMTATSVPAPSSMSSSSEKGGVDFGNAKIGVLLLNLGGPETTQDVEGFLYNLFADPDIIRLPPLLSPLQPLIATLISKRRAPKSREAYESIGGGSPILQYSKAQAQGIASSLRHRFGLEVQTYIGMRYWKPFTEQALEQIRADGISALVILPLYPQFSISTSGSSLRLLQEEFARRADVFASDSSMVHTVVTSWYDRPGYVQAMANLIQKELDSFTPEQLQQGPRHVLFSAHGVPQSYIAAGDPYQAQIVDCVAQISALLPETVTTHLSYQSRVGPIEWLRPYTDDVLPELGQAGVTNLVVVPISFVSEHIETLEEIDLEYRELAEQSGIRHWRRCPALNTHGPFLDDLADLVLESLQEPRQSLTEACVNNNVDFVVPQQDVLGVGGVGASRELRAQATLREGERFNGRLAMMGLLLTLLLEQSSGHALFRQVLPFWDS